MKVQLSCLLQALILVISAAACAGPGDSRSEYDQTKPSADPELAGGSTEIREISATTLDALGVGPKDFVMAITEKGPIIYCTDKECFAEPHKRDYHFPPRGEKVYQFIEVIQTKRNPTCYSYRDGAGYMQWRPRGCP